MQKKLNCCNLSVTDLEVGHFYKTTAHPMLGPTDRIWMFKLISVEKIVDDTYTDGGDYYLISYECYFWGGYDWSSRDNMGTSSDRLFEEITLEEFNQLKAEIL